VTQSRETSLRVIGKGNIKRGVSVVRDQEKDGGYRGGERLTHEMDWGKSPPMIPKEWEVNRTSETRGL
jgi:hypothetical protein